MKTGSAPMNGSGAKKPGLLLASKKRQQAMERLIQSGNLSRQDLAKAKALLARRQALTVYLSKINPA